MAHCKYHPLVPATYACPGCAINHCDQCAGETNRHGNTLCHFCEKPLDSLGTGSSAEPFWRRLQEAFRYPLNGHALPLIIGISVVTTLLSAIPLLGFITFIIYLALTGAMLKYSFRCLERTASGEMSAPDIGDAYEGGLTLLGKLFLMIIIPSGVITLVAAYISGALAGFLGTVLLISFPAILIQFAQSEEVIDSINPLNAIKLILTIGLPYGVLIAFIMIMMGSVGIINELLGSYSSIITRALQSTVSNYYMVVVFHIMGYMLFQYQDKLGYSARADNLNAPREKEDILSAKIDVNLKEGNYNEVVALFTEALKEFPSSKHFTQNFFDFCCNTKNKTLIGESANHYLRWLQKNREYDALNIAFSTATRTCPDFMPDNPGVRLQLAKTCRAKGIPATAVKLINGMHKAFPKYSNLAEAYTLLANALDDLNKQPQAAKCRLMAEQLKKRTPKTAAQKPMANPFAVKDVSPHAARTEENPNETPAETHNEPKELPPIEFK
ncbi:DUF4013 domain-containing protein [Teredinibacter haidensis]|uniref:DUF4013 domain-containing protein n=1 Tax=Teredinibacter haidensis TaxID=2731755 RepID=UPI000948EAD9|nr:DUF4013 domain-containing protein [Teredinibacter haidensis]